eukprot:TRINITY_DN2311_c0_g1_i1.p1 TRINITY_DN2311_c0_g1~~TRINITY_DN2311_c0_g1_i1.p1  ORF type:complete len:310 (+),score=27.01 TRINITY_DN2311_c0_g1_i1:99-1028(+)
MQFYKPFTSNRSRSFAFTNKFSGKHRPIAKVRGSLNNGAIPETESCPSKAEVARTVVQIENHGTLSSCCQDGVPLGTYVQYVLDHQGLPIMRLRHDAVHTDNIKRNSQCSVFVQPMDYPARLLARVTLVGQAVLIEDQNEISQYEQRHKELFKGVTGIDSPTDGDQYYRMDVQNVFFVGGFSQQSSAETVSREDYCAAEADPLVDVAPVIISHFNEDRKEEVLQIAAGSSEVVFGEVQDAQLLWVDKQGVYLRAQIYGRPSQILRYTFPREVQDDRSARSALTMAAQLAWEKERSYVPQVPEAIDPAVA